MNAFFLRFFFLVLLICSAFAVKQEPGFPKTNAKAKLTYKLIDAVDNTYGYDIYQAEKLLIHQASVPGIEGNKGFKTKADAEKVATLVISKIKKGEMPPTVTAQELKKLNIRL